jgi:hypothetical protein
MTWALCFNCGEVKFGAICPCPKCSVPSTGNMNLDIAFSDHNMARETLEEFGSVVAALHRATNDDQTCFWAFMHFVSKNHPSILGVQLEPDVLARVGPLVAGLQLPAVTLRPPPHGFFGGGSEGGTKRWWEFWK